LQAAHFVGRGDDAVPVELRRVAFEAPKPAGKPVYRSLALGNGDAVVYGISAVREDPSVDAQRKNMVAGQFASAIGGGEARGYAEGARAEARVIVNPHSMD
jgi:hypothetical protein